ncbi:MAG: hypothetical protein ABIR76_09905, partial [Polaromonas sp.]
QGQLNPLPAVQAHADGLGEGFKGSLSKHAIYFSLRKAISRVGDSNAAHSHSSLIRRQRRAPGSPPHGD